MWPSSSTLISFLLTIWKQSLDATDSIFFMDFKFVHFSIPNGPTAWFIQTVITLSTYQPFTSLPAQVKPSPIHSLNFSHSGVAQNLFQHVILQYKSFRVSQDYQGNSPLAILHSGFSPHSLTWPHPSPTQVVHCQTWRSMSFLTLKASVLTLITLPRHDTPDMSFYFVHELTLYIAFLYYYFLRAKISKDKNITNLSIASHCFKLLFVLTYVILRPTLELIQLSPFYS